MKPYLLALLIILVLLLAIVAIDIYTNETFHGVDAPVILDSL